MGYIVHYGNGFFRTFFYTLSTSDTSYFTGAHNCFSFVFGTAGHCLFLIVRDQFNDLLRTFCHTFAAGFTFFFIYLCNAVYNVDGVKGADFYAGSISQTAVGTGLGTAVLHQSRHLTVFNTCIFIALSSLLTVTCTFHKSRHTDAFSCFLSHDLPDLGSCRRTAYGTCVYGSFPFGDSRSQTVTAWIAAAAAVISWEGFPYQYFFFIYFYCKFLSGNSQEKSNKETYAAYQDCRNDNTCYHILCLLI